MGFKGHFLANEIYAGSMYPPGPKAGNMMFTSEIRMAKYLIKSLVGHNGVGMEAGPCHPAYTGYAVSQALCQTTWAVETLNPCRPTMAYYMWRNVATIMDDFHPAELPVKFSDGERLIFFTFQRGAAERMIAVWIDGPEKDGVVQRTDVVFPGVRAKHATVVDIMNGTEQELNFVQKGSDSIFEGMLVKDYPALVQISE